MNKKIIVINGTGGSGKDTFVFYASKYAKVFNFSSIDKIKQIARLIGWNGEKTDKSRKFLSDLKRITKEYNDMPFESIRDAVNNFNNSDNEFMFIHIREIDEIKRAVIEFNAYTLLIKREEINIIKTNESDANVENYDYDYVIKNTTLENLEESAKNFIYNLRK